MTSSSAAGFCCSSATHRSVVPAPPSPLPTLPDEPAEQKRKEEVRQQKEAVLFSSTHNIGSDIFEMEAFDFVLVLTSWTGDVFQTRL